MHEQNPIRPPFNIIPKNIMDKIDLKYEFIVNLAQSYNTDPSI
jgi:hypothetical protein